MIHTHTLTRHRDIQNWVIDRQGMPAITRTHNQLGEMSPRLTLRFSRTRRPTGMPTQDDGITPVSWSAWLAELDRQQLALKVTRTSEPTFELIERKNLN